MKNPVSLDLVGTRVPDTAGAGNNLRIPMLRSLLAVGLALGLAVPIPLVIGDIDVGAGPAQLIAVATVLLVLPTQVMGDIRRWRRGSAIRVAVLAMIVASTIAWLLAAFSRGFSLAALFSLVNWAALGGLVVMGQLLAPDMRRISISMRTWLGVQTVIAAGSIGYLLSRFGLGLFTLTTRGDFQVAMHSILAGWPNGSGLTFAVATCICYAYGRRRMVSLIGVQFVILAMGTMVTYSRNAWLCTTIGLMAITFVNQPWRRSVLTAVAIAVVITLLIGLVPPVRFQIVASLEPGSSQMNSVVERLAFAAEAARIWWEHPMIGIGFGRFEDVANLARLSAGAHVSSSYVPGSAHNEYLSTLLKGGLLSGLSFFAFLIVSWRIFSRNAHARVGTEAWRWGSAGIGILTTLLVGGFGGESFRSIGVSGPFFILVGGLSMLAPARGGTSIERQVNERMADKGLPHGTRPREAHGGAQHEQ